MSSVFVHVYQGDAPRPVRVRVVASMGEAKSILESAEPGQSFELTDRWEGQLPLPREYQHLRHIPEWERDE